MCAEHWPTSDLPVRERRLHTTGLSFLASAVSQNVRGARTQPRKIFSDGNSRCPDLPRHAIVTHSLPILE